MRIEIPELCVVALIGASGSGKTSLAKKYFKPTEVLSSDYFRGLISDDQNDQNATKAAFESLYFIAGKRLDNGKLTVIDATNVQKGARDAVIKMARDQNCFAVAIVLNMPEDLCQKRNELRPDRDFGPHVIKNQNKDLKRSIRHLKKEGFRSIYVISSEEEANQIEIIRTKPWNDKTDLTGPFDIIGDIHGCYDELCLLLSTMGYHVDKEACTAKPPDGRKAIFLGDLCDRGPKNVAVLRMVMDMVEKNHALCLPGNHDAKLLKRLKGANVSLDNGLDVTVSQIEAEPDKWVLKVQAFLDSLISHYVLDGGKLVVAHAGIIEKYQGRSSGRVRSFCLYGDTTGEKDEFGLPVRLPWAEDYRGVAKVIYGHTPSVKAHYVNNTICIDTGCVFGGKLTAYRYPEDELAEVGALMQYYEPAKPLAADYESRPLADMLSIDDVKGRRHIDTRLHQKSVTVGEQNAASALEIMSRFAADPHWLIYLPPTMSPCTTSKLAEYLEHPLEAFGYYKKQGVQTVVCEQKHMGSRAVIVLCRDNQTAIERFGVSDNTTGLIYTRTGRHFFEDIKAEQAILARLKTVLDHTGFWEAFNTNWVCLDTELMPWSAKAQALITQQYAPTGRSGRNGLLASIDALKKAVASQQENGMPDMAPSSISLQEILHQYQENLDNLNKYTDAYRQYCWSVASIDDYRIAPFHILATEGTVWNDKNHLMQMQTIQDYMTGVDPIFIATAHIELDLTNEASIEKGVSWWLDLTKAGGEGMVVKPLDFIVHNGRELLQPAVKCRGREYLRIIYGPQYTMAPHMARLKKRSLSKKRRLALAEFSLGMESLERFVSAQPIYRVHECVFAVLALESEPVDPRL